MNPDRYRGTYEREGLREEVVDIADGLVVRMTLTGLLASPRPRCAWCPSPRTGSWPGRWLPVTFHEVAYGRRYLHSRRRAALVRRPDRYFMLVGC
ncbi:hypothetical protein [Nocardia terpenica]|uniref:hypothetical protein n=1 Tax=Nocardia terpenica TaxID=455432 RepID=UPI0002D2F698|nr:hypothetical protein [Nocardia terpenica]NQE87408.1 hypothetical protein [Nocardia terpenica]